MMITILIIAILVWAYLIGRSRGLALQSFYTLGLLIAFLTALEGYQGLAKKITLWVPFASATSDSHLAFYSSKLLFEIDHVFYAILSFLAIYVAVYGIVRLIGIFLGALENKMVLGDTGNRIAGILSVLVVYVMLSIGMMLLSTIPLTLIQNQLHASWLVRLMINQTPLFSAWLQDIFIKQITHLTL
ncbi:MAG: CvpA family protein [Streptococcaceae bacterium]|jgi:uncharacterized membrane protein required for colicin V production|nr:CvpA family protein [Streptococcaceae bacterium]